MEDPRPVIIENPSMLCYDAIQVLYLPLYMGAPALKTITNNNSAVLYKVCMKFDTWALQLISMKDGH